MTITFRTLLAAIALVSALSSAKVSAVLPGADDPRAYTQATYTRQTLEFNKRTMSGAYQKVGARNAAWDDAAVAFLDDMALRFSNHGVSVITAARGEKPAPKLLESARALVVDSGCVDPLVTYCYGVLLHESGDVAGAGEQLGNAARAMMTSEYPLFRRVRSVQRWLETLQKDNVPPEMLSFCFDNLAVIPQSPECQGHGRRIILTVWQGIFEKLSLDQRGPLIETMLADDKADKWFTHNAAGAFFIREAWRHRGGGWASSVTDEGWKGFHDSLARASDVLQIAHGLEPKYPEAATQMITVAMGAGRNLKLNEREWFDRAVAAQLDYKHAYGAYLHALQPRWGGSHQAIFEVAKECAAAGRFDTELPFRFEELLTGIIIDDAVAGPRFVASPQVYDVAAPVFDGLAEATRPYGFANFHLTYKLALELKLRRYDEARVTLDQLTGPPDPQPLVLFTLTPSEVASKVHAMTGPQGEQMRAIETRIMARDTARAVEDLEAVAAALATANKDDPGLPFVNLKVHEYKFARSYEAGEWVNVQPTKEFLGWRPFVGEWRIDDQGNAVGNANHNSRDLGRWTSGPVLQFTGKLGPRYAVKFHVAGDGPQRGVMVAGGPPNPYAGVFLYRAQQPLIRVIDGESMAPIPFDLRPEGTDILVEVWDDSFSVTVDGRRVATDRPMPPVSGRNLSLGSLSSFKDRPLIFSDVHVKQLTRKP